VGQLYILQLQISYSV